MTRGEAAVRASALDGCRGGSQRVDRIPRDVVDAVRERTDIGEVIGRHVSLLRRGRSLVGLCPFHQEKTPSFHVIPDKGIYHCFGCQAGGDVFKFLMTLEGLSFVEAVKELAAAAGITIEEREVSPAERKAITARATAFDVLEAACRFFEAQLWTGPVGAEAREYLLTKRAMTADQVRAARLGWAPGGWTRLIDHLHREGYDPEQIATAGVARPRERGGFYDTLRERVTIPIRDERGRIIGFGGRILEGEGPKYLNTPETALYQKSHVLYGLDVARSAIQRTGRVLVVEGYFDVLSLHQAGFGEAVATCGTALTPEHLEKIRRLARDVVLLMDADEAGLRAAERALPLFVEAQIQPWRLRLTGAKDPDELVRTEGAAAFEAILAAREPLFEWVVQRKLDAYGTSAMSRDRVLADVVPMLQKLRDPHLARQVARRLDLAEDVVLSRVREPASTAPPAEPRPEVWQPQKDVTHLLWLVVHRYAQVADLLTRADPKLLEGHGPVQAVLARLLVGESVAAVAEDQADAAVRRTLHVVVARDLLYSEEEAATALVQVLVRLWRPRYTARMAALREDVDRVATTAQQVDAVRILRDLQRVDRRLTEAIRKGRLDEAIALLHGGARAAEVARSAE